MEKKETNNKIDTNKIATLTGKAIQDDEIYKTEGSFIPERDQFYFEMQQEDNTFLVGVTDLLLCLKLLEQLDEIPKLPNKWWHDIQSLYGYDTYMLESSIKENTKDDNNERN